MSDTITTAEDDVLYADTRKAMSGLRKRMLFIMLPLVLCVFVFSGVMIHLISLVQPVLRPVPPPAGHPSPHAQTPLPVTLIATFPWLLLVEVVFLYVWAGRSHKNQREPIVVLSPQGIAVDTQGTHLGLIRWDEIAEVRCYTFIYRYVGIVPADMRALCRRLGRRRAWLIRLNAAVIPLYKPFGLFVAPINIPQVYLPITAEELLTRIQAYRATYAAASVCWPHTVALPDAGTWPPPPGISGRP